MPEKRTLERARKDKQAGKAPSTQAGEFVREEMDHIRSGKHGAKNTKQAIAIGLSKARRAGVKLAAPKKGTTSEATRKKAAKDSERGRKHPNAKPNAKRSKATSKALKKQPRSAASHRALSTQAKKAAAKRKRTGTTTRKAAKKRS
jgi:hypothetical protein